MTFGSRHDGSGRLRSTHTPDTGSVVIATAAGLGTRLGRIKTLGLGAFADQPSLDFALQHHLRNDGAGLLVLCEKLELRESTRKSLHGLVDSINAFYSLSTDERRRRDEPHALLINDLYSDIKIQLELAYGEAALWAFSISYDILQTQLFFRARSDGEANDPNHLMTFLYSEDVYGLVRVGLSNLQDFCESQDQSPIPVSEIRRFATAFRDRALSARQLNVLRSHLLHSWIEALEHHFARTQLYVREGRSSSPRDLCAQCLEIGQLCGGFEILTEMAADNVSQVTRNLHRLEFYLVKLGIPFDVELVRSRLKGAKGGIELKWPEDTSARAEYQYAVGSRLTELVACELGRMAKSLVAIGLSLGAIRPLVWFGSTSPEEDNTLADDEPVFDADFREIVLPSMHDLIEKLDRRWMTKEFLAKVTESVQAWSDPRTPPASVLALRTFFTDTIDGELVEQALATVAASHLMLPYHLEHLRPSVAEFIRDHPNYDSNCFIMMRFEDSPLQMDLSEAVRDGLQAVGLVGVRADERDYTGELWSNLCVYMLGCSSGVAIFDQVEELGTNPNVALEVGFMLASGKRVLLLKDKRTPSMPSDLIGRLYRSFDSGQILATVTKQIRAWADDMGAYQSSS